MVQILGQLPTEVTEYRWGSSLRSSCVTHINTRQRQLNESIQCSGSTWLGSPGPAPGNALTTAECWRAPLDSSLVPSDATWHVTCSGMASLSPAPNTPTPLFCAHHAVDVVALFGSVKEFIVIKLVWFTYSVNIRHDNGLAPSWQTTLYNMRVLEQHIVTIIFYCRVNYDDLYRKRNVRRA